MARFDDLDRLGDAIGDVYADCVDRLLVTRSRARTAGASASRTAHEIARHFRYLKPGEEPGGAL